MNEKMLWDKFCENGSVESYLIYRNFVDSADKTELESIGKDNCTGPCDKGTEYR